MGYSRRKNHIVIPFHAAGLSFCIIEMVDVENTFARKGSNLYYIGHVLILCNIVRGNISMNCETIRDLNIE